MVNPGEQKIADFSNNNKRCIDSQQKHDKYNNNDKNNILNNKSVNIYIENRNTK